MPTYDITHLSAPSKKKNLRNIYYENKWSFTVSDKLLTDLEYYNMLDAFLQNKRVQAQAQANNYNTTARANATFIHDKDEYLSILERLREGNVGETTYRGFELANGAGSCNESHHLVIREKRLTPNSNNRTTRKVLLVSEMFNKLFDLFSEYRHDFNTFPVEKVLLKIMNDDNGKSFGGYAFVQSWFTDFSRIINLTYSQYHPKVVTSGEYKSKIVPPVVTMQTEIDLCEYWGSYLTDGELPSIKVMEWINEMFYDPSSRVIQHSSKTPYIKKVKDLLFPGHKKSQHSPRK